MLKSYEEMRQIDVRPYCKKRDGMDYLNYSKCIDLLHKNGAEVVYFLPIQNPATGSSLIATNEVFTDKNGVTNRCYETRIEIHIDDKVYYMQSPLMNGANPVKDNSMSQQRIWNSMTRSFVKGVAIYTGLGFDLWLEEEDEDEKKQQNANQYHDINKVQERVFETVTALNKKGLTLTDIAEKLGRTKEELQSYLNMYKTLAAVEHNLNVLLKES